MNTPLVVLSDAPLTLLPPHSAYIVFVLIQYGLAAFVAFILAKTFELKNTRLIITAVVASPAPFLVGFFGQIGAYVFLAFVIALWAGKKNYAMLTGVAIACTLIKPQLGICIAVALPWGAPWRTWLGFGLTGLALLGVTVIMLSPSGAIAYVHALQMFQHSNFATHSPDSLGLTSLYYGWASSAMSIFLKISLGIIMVVALVLLAIRYKYRPTSQACAAVIYILVLVTSYSHQYDAIALLPCLWMARLPHGKVMNAVAVIG